MLPVEGIYEYYLRSLQDNNKEKYKDYKGYFSASGAGSCYKKQLYRALGYEGVELKSRPLRLLRLGTLLHTDFEEAFKQWIDSAIESKDWIIWLEERIIIEEWNVIGHGDIWGYHKPTQTLYGYDLKSAGVVKWRLKYGRNPIPAENYMYEMQLATYLEGFLSKCNEEGIKVADSKMSILWYKKDDSVMKEESLDPSIYIPMASDYWEELNELKDEIGQDIESIGFGDPGIPMQPKWECGYCEFASRCRRDI